MSIKIVIPSAFKKATLGKTSVTLKSGEASTVREMIDALVRVYPRLEGNLYDEQRELQRFVNVFVNGLDIRFSGGLDCPLHDGDEVQLVPAIAGGRE